MTTPVLPWMIGHGSRLRHGSPKNEAAHKVKETRALAITSRIRKEEKRIRPTNSRNEIGGRMMVISTSNFLLLLFLFQPSDIAGIVGQRGMLMTLHLELIEHLKNVDSSRPNRALALALPQIRIILDVRPRAAQDPDLHLPNVDGGMGAF